MSAIAISNALLIMNSQVMPLQNKSGVILVIVVTRSQLPLKAE